MFAVTHKPPFASLPREALELYGYAVQVIAAADGRLTREERELVFDEKVTTGLFERGVFTIAVITLRDVCREHGVI
jgi:hypothetical protein